MSHDNDKQKHYRITLHLLFTSDIYASDINDALNFVRDESHWNSENLVETNNEIEEIHETD